MNAKHKQQTLAAMITAVHAELANVTKVADMTAERANKADLTLNGDAVRASNEVAGCAMMVQERLDKVQELLRGVLALNSMPTA